MFNNIITNLSKKSLREHLFGRDFVTVTGHFVLEHENIICYIINTEYFRRRAAKVRIF